MKNHTDSKNCRRYYGHGIPRAKLEDAEGSLIVVEGADGSGRSTQIARLVDWLETNGHPTVQVGLKRSTLVSSELEKAQHGNILSRTTLSLFYATDAVFYLSVEPEELVQRNLSKNATLDYWESGMDIGLSRDVFDSFLKYQTLMQETFRKLQKTYDFDIVDANRSTDSITKELRKKIGALLEAK
jgi:dTMP kinase